MTERENTKRRRTEEGFVQDDKLLSIKNKHARDDAIFFRVDDHKYLNCVSGKEDQKLTSASTFVGQFFEPFVVDKVIAQMHASPKWTQSEYYPMTSDEIKAQWDSGRDLGTDLHDVIERYLNDEPPTSEQREKVDFQQFLDFEAEWLHDRDVVVYRTEWRIYDEDSGLSGTLDWICAYTDQADPDVLRMMLLDHKRSKEIKIKDKWKKRGLRCCSDVYATNYYKYGLALNLYKYILEKNYHDVVHAGKTYKRVHVDDMYLNVMHPVHETYQVFQIPDMQPKIQEMLLDKNENQ